MHCIVLVVDHRIFNTLIVIGALRSQCVRENVIMCLKIYVEALSDCRRRRCRVAAFARSVDQRIFTVSQLLPAQGYRASHLKVVVVIAVADFFFYGLALGSFVCVCCEKPCSVGWLSCYSFHGFFFSLHSAFSAAVAI